MCNGTIPQSLALQAIPHARHHPHVVCCLLLDFAVDRHTVFVALSDGHDVEYSTAEDILTSPLFADSRLFARC